MLYFLAAILRVPVLEGKTLSFLRPYYVQYFRPHDLYVPLAEFDIDPSNHEAIYRFTLSHRYVGTYSVGLNIEKDFQFNTESLDWGSRFKLLCTHNDSTLLSTVIGAEPAPFIDAEHKGFALFQYQVPEVLPRDTAITCRVTTIEGGESFQQLFGKATFFVRMWTDR
jgi:hypothetical protein